MIQSDPIFAAVTGPGSPFEVGERGGIAQFVNAPPDLSLLIESARRHGEKTFIVEGERRLSFEEVFAARDALAAELGIARRDRVAICMRNRAEWMISFLAILKAGGVAVLVNSRGASGEMAAMVADVSPALVIADAERAEALRKAGFAGRIIEPTVGVSGIVFPIISGTEKAVPKTDPEAQADPDNPAAILFTSGTTGRVKGAVLSHKNLITGILAVQLSGTMVLHNMARTMGIPVETILANAPQGATLMVYPLFHISGLGAGFLSPLLAGTKIVMMPRWDAEEALRLIAEEKITQLTAVPTMLWDLLNRAKLGEADLSSLRNIGTGGQALPVNLLDAIRNTCPQAVMGTGYGLTETAGSVAMALGEDFIRNRASAGRVLPLVDMKIDAPKGKAGEIVVRGAMVMQGYWERPEETAAVLSADGWFRTGDVGTIDEEGYVFIVDRKKDMVISGGENIYCAEVERVMGSMEGVSECAAFGIPDERWGEALVAVVKAEGVTEAEIKTEVADRLARYKAPTAIRFVEETLPRNVLGKVDKIKLRAMWPGLTGDT
jgi:long-chain acyl-CoA synthetase